MTLGFKDTIAGVEGTAFMEIDGQNVEMFYVKNINATMTKNKIEGRTLGRRGNQHKTVGWNGEGSMTIWKVTSQFVKLAVQYAKTGRDVFVNIVTTNEDPTSSIGAQRVILIDVNFDSYPITLLDIDAESLEEELDFTFDDLDLLEEFSNPA